MLRKNFCEIRVVGDGVLMAWSLGFGRFYVGPEPAKLREYPRAQVGAPVPLQADGEKQISHPEKARGTTCVWK